MMTSELATSLNPLEIQQQRAMVSAARIKRGGYHQFVKEAWDQIEQVELEDEPHLKFIADHIEALFLGNLEHELLLVNIPPAHSKTILCVIMLAPWAWSVDPTTRIGFVHNDINLARDAARKARQLIGTEWYQARWPGVRLADDASKIERFSNTEGGSRACFTVRQQITGWHAGSKSGRGLIIIDDPNRPDDTEKDCEHIQEWFSEALPTRFANQRKKGICVVQQRLHHRDLSQHILDTEENLDHVCLPMEYSPERRCVTSLGTDWRLEEGAILAPTRFPLDVVEKLKKAFINPRAGEAQLNQNPAPEDGSLFRTSHFENRYHIPDLSEETAHRHLREEAVQRRKRPPAWPDTWLPERLRVYLSWDCTYTAAETSDYAVGTVWGVGNGRFYLLDLYRAQMSFTDTVTVVEKQLQRWPRYAGLLIEQAASGHALTDMLRKAGVKKIIPIKTSRFGKQERAHASTFAFEDAQVWFPEAEPNWFAAYQRELLQFPAGKYDDQVDSTTQFISWATAARPIDISLFMRKAGKLADKIR